MGGVELHIPADIEQKKANAIAAAQDELKITGDFWSRHRFQFLGIAVTVEAAVFGYCGNEVRKCMVPVVKFKFQSPSGQCLICHSLSQAMEHMAGIQEHTSG